VGDPLKRAAGCQGDPKNPVPMLFVHTIRILMDMFLIHYCCWGSNE
jgi:hypothetical protein